MLKRIVVLAAVFAAFTTAAFFVLTEPQPLAADALPNHQADTNNGATLFWAGGCASCHAAPNAAGDERLRLAGGVRLVTPFGTFVAPNISSDREAGIGAWSELDFINAMRKGLSPDGRHYYPAFPYPNYQRMPLSDLIDLKAFLDGLPAINTVAPGHELKFPFNIRRGLGLWKQLYLGGEDEVFRADPAAPAALERGRYLVRGPAHCGACHTPRDVFGGEIAERFLAGAELLETGEGDEAGRAPNITPHADGIGDWSERDIAYALQSGFDPDFDSFGGSMVEVQNNMAELSDEDRAAIALYLKSIPALLSKER